MQTRVLSNGKAVFLTVERDCAMGDTESFPDRLALELAANTVDGAGTLARQALRGLRAHIEALERADMERMLPWARMLMDARPGIGAIGNLLQYWMDSMPAIEGGQADVRGIAVQHCDRVLARADEAFEKTIGVGRERLSGISGPIVTHSASSTVRHLLAVVPPRQVIVGASEPGGEGRGLAAELGAICVSDAEAVRQVGHAGAVLVGADAIGTDSFVNKIGTLALAEAAQEAGTPFFVIAESFKWVPGWVPGWVPATDPPVMEPVFETVPNTLVREFLSDSVFRS